MNAIFRCWFRARKNAIRRLDKTTDTATSRPVFSSRPIDYEVAHRHRAIAHGGIGAIHMLAHRVGLPQAIDQHLHLLKVHLPYHESDRVLNIAYNPLCHGTCLQDIELRRNHEASIGVNFGACCHGGRVPQVNCSLKPHQKEEAGTRRHRLSMMGRGKGVEVCEAGRGTWPDMVFGGTR